MNQNENMKGKRSNVLISENASRRHEKELAHTMQYENKVSYFHVN